MLCIHTLRAPSVFAAVAATLCAVIGGPSAADAGSPAACKTYAQDAVAQYRNMRGNAKCRLKDSARWQPHTANHYNWCLKAPASWIDSERGARIKHLAKCGGATSFD